MCSLLRVCSVGHVWVRSYMQFSTICPNSCWIVPQWLLYRTLTVCMGAVTVLLVPNSVPTNLAVLQFGYHITMIILFGQFYYKTYYVPAQAAKKAKAAAKAAAKDNNNNNNKSTAESQTSSQVPSTRLLCLTASASLPLRLCHTACASHHLTASLPLSRHLTASVSRLIKL